MLGETSDFGALDLLGTLGVNAVASQMAVKNPTLRVGIKNKSGDVPAWGDVRFIAGVLAAGASQFLGYEWGTTRRVAHDVATGLLNSYVATETCRRAAIARVEAAQSAPPQISESVAPAAAPAPATTSAAMGYDW